MSGNPTRCAHDSFEATVNVLRLQDGEHGPVTGYMAEVRIACQLCGKRFQFLGLEPGCDTHGAGVSIDGLEARIALSPEGERPNPMQRIAYNVRGFDA